MRRKVLQTWRINRREETFYRRAMARADKFSTADAVMQIDLALMASEQCLTRYRHAFDKDYQEDQLREIRFNLEVCLGILDVVLVD